MNEVADSAQTPLTYRRLNTAATKVFLKRQIWFWFSGSVNAAEVNQIVARFKMEEGVL